MGRGEWRGFFFFSPLRPRPQALFFILLFRPSFRVRGDGGGGVGSVRGKEGGVRVCVCAPSEKE